MDTKHFKAKLEAESKRLEAELKSLGQKSTSAPGGWEATEKKSDIDADRADDMEVADAIEDFESNTSILGSLEVQYKDVKDALDKIQKGTYGTCEVSGHPIELDRLEANPAARTCKEHINR